MVEIRQLQKQDREAAIALSNQTFRDDEQTSMVDAFPLMFSPGNIEQSIGAFAEGELVSFMGIVPAFIRIGTAKVAIYSLGSVCTAEEHRNKGYASQILDKVFQYLKTTDAALLLVSGDRSLYTRADCCYFGNSKRYLVNGKNAKYNHNIREMREGDLLSLVHLAQQRPIRYDQSVSDFQTLLQAEAFASCLKLTHKTLIMEENGELTSFLVLGIPNQTGKSIAIEWAGNPNEITQLLAYAAKKYELEEIEVPIPWHDQELQKELHDAPFKSEKNQGTIYIIDPERLVKQLAPFLKTKLEEPIQCKSIQDGMIEVGIGTHKAILTKADFISVLFDPEPNNEKNKELQKESQGVFPLPFPYTAGLNYV
ncbi:hypothetical protein WQ54_05535 [Bacillus sp. SA1-12]|uniref:GNAT family N-acetyltransferase n=1 Tax=Bacillus sp. SA1-12 TaxID=1455638 RepID=UPI0006256F71|nr:GNAT family N-acetyltransferase [Bacillus sp. SA1-12]KKI93290.1 hypothetical protein WQ54_05535 [Bacillus sp. SA1-12]